MWLTKKREIIPTRAPRAVDVRFIGATLTVTHQSGSENTREALIFWMKSIIKLRQGMLVVSRKYK